MNYHDILETLEALSLDGVETPELDLEGPAPEGYSDDE